MQDQVALRHWRAIEKTDSTMIRSTINLLRSLRRIDPTYEASQETASLCFWWEQRKVSRREIAALTKGGSL